MVMTSRRRAIGAAASAALATVATRTVRGQENTSQASPDTGTWSLTDDLGVTVTLPARPTRVIADLNAAAPLWDFGIRPIAVSGWTVTSDASWGNVDRATPVINATDGAPEPDIETILELEAELFVTIAWAPGDIWSFTSPEAYETTRSAVPVVAISVAGLASENMKRFVELAGLLGADLESAELVAAKATFDTAVTSFSTLAKSKSEITSLFAGIDVAASEWYVASPQDWADLSWYQSLGMNIVEPDVDKGKFWETLSREEAVKYPSDILFNSTRAGRTEDADLQSDPVFGMHPAVAAGQIGDWNQDFILSYQGMTAALESMIDVLASAEKVSG